MGATLLISMEHLYAVMSRHKKDEPKPVVGQGRSDPGAAPSPQARPTGYGAGQAITLMLAAAAKGDVTTAYAQWDIGPMTWRR